MASAQQGVNRFVCPHCGSGEVSENNSLAVRVRVSEWTREGEPAAFAYPWSLIDDTMRVAVDRLRYYCGHCEKEFEEVSPKQG